MIAQSERHTDTKIESLENRIDVRLSNLPTTLTLVYIVAGAVVSGVLLLIGIFAFAGERFDGGMGYGLGVGEKYSESAIELDRNAQRDEETRRSVQSLGERMDRILKILERDSQTK